jgi:hypothetical protein
MIELAPFSRPFPSVSGTLILKNKNRRMDVQNFDNCINLHHYKLLNLILFIVLCGMLSRKHIILLWRSCTFNCMEIWWMPSFDRDLQQREIPFLLQWGSLGEGTAACWLAALQTEPISRIKTFPENTCHFCSPLTKQTLSTYVILYAVH